MTKSAAIDPSVPAGSEDPKLGDNRIRTLAAAVAELLGVNHYMGSDGGAGTGYSEDDAGQHRVVHLRAESSPSAQADTIALFGKDVNAKTEVHTKDEDGNEIQLTTAGFIKKSVIQDSAFVPPGVFLPYGGASAPTGWLLCNGAAVSRTTYADLFSAIGVGYGIGDSSTTFNLPDMRGRVPVGLDAANAHLAAADTLGETGGEESHALTLAENGAHTHGMPSYSGNDVAAPQNFNMAGNDQSGGPTNIATASSGSGTGHNNLQPYNTVNYIIKT
ncbi:MAG: tail fiber protein [Planctomycetota bacterium]